jgi:hypothetical protein
VLTTILFGLGLVMLWRKPSWGRLVAFATLIFVAYVALVWVSTGFYLSTARAPLGERWNVVLLQALLWIGAFVSVGSVMIWSKRRVAQRAL